MLILILIQIAGLVNNNEELKDDMDDNTSMVWPQIRLMAVTKYQVLLNDPLIKHKASLLLYDEICHLFKEYISSPNFGRFAKFKSRKSLLTSTQKTFNSKTLQPINSLSAKSVLTGDKLIAMYSIST